MGQVSLADAYAEACRALGESIVRELLLSQEIQRLTMSEPLPSLIEDPG